MEKLTDLYTEGYFERGEGSNYYNYGDDPGWDPTARILREFLPGGSYPKLLELGSAKGYFLAAAHRHGFVSRGVDVSTWAVSQTPMWLQSRNVVHDLTELYFPEKIERWCPYDVVCSWELLEHIESDQIPNLFTKSLDMLRSGGLFVHRIALLEAGMDEDKDHTHVTMWERPTWEKIFSLFNLEHVPILEERLRTTFTGRDWSERFFAWRKP